MKSFELTGLLRTELGKKPSKAVRVESAIPCVIYGGEKYSIYGNGKRCS